MKMKVAFDIDGTVDSDPAVFQSLLMALKAAGHQVIILTGVSSETVSPSDVESKKQYLNSIGLGKCYNQIVCFGDPPHQAKAQWIKKNKVDLFVDNSAANAQLAADHCLVLVPWNTLIDGKIKNVKKV